MFELREATPANRRRLAHRSADGGRHAGQRARSRFRDSRFAANGRIHIIDARDSDESDARDPVRLAEPGRRIAGAGQHRGQRRPGSLARAGAGEHAVARDSRRSATASANESRCRRRQYDYLRVQRTDGGPPLAINGVIAERVGAAEKSSLSGSWRRRSPTDDIQSVVLRYRAPRTGELRALAPAAGEQLGARDAAQPRRRQGAMDRALERRGLPDRHRYGAARKSAGAFRARPAIATGACRSRRIRSCIARRCWSWATGPRACASWRRDRARSRSHSAAGAREISAASGCDALLADVGSEERARLVGEGVAQGARVLGGDDALAAAAAPDAACGWSCCGRC